MGYNKTPGDRRKEAKERAEVRSKRTITEQLELIVKRPGKSEKEVRKLYQQMKTNEKGNEKKRERTSKAHSS